MLLGLSSLWWYLYVDPNGGLASVDVSSPIFWSSLYAALPSACSGPRVPAFPRNLRLNLPLSCP